MTKIDIAQFCHEVNRAYCQSIGDMSQLPWEDAPLWQKESALSGVELHLSGNHDASTSHNRWMEEKIANGWSYGEEKDEEKKTHFCLVPFDELPVEQQSKDYLFKAVVHLCKPFLDI